MTGGDSAEIQRQEAFVTWFKAQPEGAFSSAIRLVDLSAAGRGRGIIATEDIPADAKLFTIPRKAVLSVENSAVTRQLPRAFVSGRKAGDDGGSEDSDGDGDVDSDDFPDRWLELIIVLIYEYLRREASTWFPYLNILPMKLDTLMYWDSSELRELQSSAIVDKVGKEEAEYTFHDKLLPLIKEHPDVFYPKGAERLTDDELIHLAHRMGGIIMAYAFDLEKEDADDADDEEDGWVQDHSQLMSLGLLPMADMLNADAEFNAHLNHEENVLTMTSLRPIKAGEEVLNYYGPLPNSELLRRYGYTSSKHSLYDVVEVPWKLIREAIFDHFGPDISLPEDTDVEESFVLERETEGPDETGVNNSSASFTQFPEDLEEQILPIIAPLLNIEIGDEDLRITDQQVLGQTFYQIMRRALDARIKQYPTSIETDQELLSNKGLVGRTRKAIIVRLGEKMLLREAIHYADNVLVNGHAQSDRESSAEPIPKKRKMQT